MSLWQRSMIALARSERLKQTMQRFGSTTRLARRFVGGDGAEGAVRTARRLRDEFGITASLFYLGEYIGDPVAVEQNVEMTIAVAERLGAEGLDAHVSIDPTAIGSWRARSWARGTRSGSHKPWPDKHQTAATT